MRFILLCYASRAYPHHEMPRKKWKAALNYFSPQSSSKLFCCLSDGHIAALIVLNVNNPHLSHKTMKTSSIVLKLHLCICLKYKHIIFYLIIVSKSERPHKTNDAFQRVAEFPLTIFMSRAQAKCSTGK